MVIPIIKGNQIRGPIFLRIKLQGTSSAAYGKTVDGNGSTWSIKLHAGIDELTEHCIGQIVSIASQFKVILHAEHLCVSNVPTCELRPFS